MLRKKICVYDGRGKNVYIKREEEVSCNVTPLASSWEIDFKLMHDRGRVNCLKFLITHHMILMILNGKITIEENSGRVLSGYLYDLNDVAREEISKYAKISSEWNCYLMQWGLSRSIEDCIIDNLCWRDLYHTMRCLE